MTTDDTSTRPHEVPPAERTYLVDGQQRYRVEGRLGAGAFGAVFKCWHEQTDTWVAIKRVHVPEADATRLMREATLAGQVESEYVARTRASFYDAHNSLLYLVTDFASEGDLGVYLKGRPHPLPLGEALEISRAVARGVAAIHARGIIHRDLKPANILMFLRDERVCPRLGDFGLARSVSTASISEFASPGFSAPEQMAFEGAGFESDLFSLGLVLYELLTGTRASDARDLAAHAAWLRGIKDRPLGPPSNVRPELARFPVLDTMVARLTDWDRTARARLAASEVVDALHAALGGVAPESVALTPQANVRPGRVVASWKPAAIGAVLVIGVLAAVYPLVRNQEDAVTPAPGNLTRPTATGMDDPSGGGSVKGVPQTGIPPVSSATPNPAPPQPAAPKAVSTESSPTIGRPASTASNGPPAISPSPVAEPPAGVLPPNPVVGLPPNASSTPTNAPATTPTPSPTASPPANSPPKDVLAGEWRGHVDDGGSRPTRLQLTVDLTASAAALSGNVVIDGKCKGTWTVLERTSARTWFEQRMESGNCAAGVTRLRAELRADELEVQMIGPAGQSVWHGWLKKPTAAVGDSATAWVLPPWAPGTFTGVRCVDPYPECRMIIKPSAAVTFQVFRDTRPFMPGPIPYTDIPCEWELGLNRITCTFPKNQRGAFDVTDTAAGIVLTPVGGRGRLELKRVTSR